MVDSYSDDLPYYETVNGRPHLIVPYTLDTNDMRFASAQGFNSGTQFFDYLKDAFDVLTKKASLNPKCCLLVCTVDWQDDLPGRQHSLDSLSM